MGITFHLSDADFRIAGWCCDFCCSFNRCTHCSFYAHWQHWTEETDSSKTEFLSVFCTASFARLSTQGVITRKFNTIRHRWEGSDICRFSWHVRGVMLWRDKL